MINYYKRKAAFLKKYLLNSPIYLIMNWDNCKPYFDELGISWRQHKDYLEVWL